MEQKIPAVSVVIPMYNAEKFITPCLESLSGQTFKDFEIIVVDHCSTDGSRELVEDFTKKFTGDGGLRLVRLGKNFGNPCVPRNKGLNFSRGKYVYFMDADDLLMDNALKILYQSAEKYGADFIIMPNWYEFVKNTDRPFPEELVPYSWWFASKNVRPPLQQFEIDTGNPGQRIVDYMDGKFPMMPWLKFSRRDFLLENDLTFPMMPRGEDDFWTIKLLCSAKKILLIPHAFYIHRTHLHSFVYKPRSLEEIIEFDMTLAVDGMKVMRELFQKHEFFQQNPQYWCALINFNFGFAFAFQSIFNNASQYELYDAVRKVFFSGDSDGEKTDLISYLCTYITLQRKDLLILSERIAELERQIEDVRSNA